MSRRNKATNQKATNQRYHAKRRAFNRYGLKLHRDAQETIIRAIQAGKARFIERQSWRVSMFEVEHEGQMLPVIYDKKRKTIATVLPQEALSEPGKEADHDRTQQLV